MVQHLPYLLGFAFQSSDSGGGSSIAIVFWVIVVLIVWKVMASAAHKKKLEKARRDAHNFVAPNIHGGPREASKKDLKSKGWIK